MALKKTVKRVIGKKNTELLKKIVHQGQYINDSIKKYTSNLCLNCDYSIYEVENANIFFGYYDLRQFDVEGNRLLAHIIPKYAKTGIDKAQIVYIDAKKKCICEVTQSSAWSWQQGSRLRWNPINSSQILFNNFDGTKYVCELWDIFKRKKIGEYPYAFYDLDDRLSYGLTLDFSRLQRLRPGYGYNNIIDKTINDHAPRNDGIYKYEIGLDKFTQIISTFELAKYKKVDSKYDNYINHISIAPDGEHFIFFHIWTEGEYLGRKTALYVVDKTGNNLKCLEDEYIVSHYAWRNEHEILVTTLDGKYLLYNINSCVKKDVLIDDKPMDGHPSFYSSNLVISDTYPQKHRQQQLYAFDINEGKKKIIAKIFSDPRLYDEKRCDLHPRIDKDRGIVTVDSTFKDGKRSIIEMNIKKELIECIK